MGRIYQVNINLTQEGSFFLIRQIVRWEGWKFCKSRWLVCDGTLVSSDSLSDSLVPFFCMFNFDCASRCDYVATGAFTDNLGIYGFALYFEGMKGIIIFLTRMVAIGVAMWLFLQFPPCGITKGI